MIHATKPERPKDFDKEGNLTTGFSSEANIKPDGTPGSGSSSWIRFNYLDEEGGEDIYGNTKRPIEVGLAHELFHALLNMEGYNDNKIGYIGRERQDNGRPISITEFHTRLLENLIRQEHGVNYRKLPIRRN